MAYELAFVLTGESDELEEALQRATQEERELEASTEDVMRSQIRWNDEVQRFIGQNGRFVSALDAGKELREELNALGIQTTEQLEREIELLETLETAYQDDAHAMAQLTQRKEMLVDRLEGTGRATAQASDELERFGRRGQAGTQILFSLGEGLQDAQFGFRGVANNIAYTAEQFSLLVARAGGLSAALRVLGASILGAGGIVAGIQVLLAFGPKIVSFFKRWVTGAEEAKDATDDLEDEVRRIARTNRSTIETIRSDEELLVQALAAVKERILENRRELAAGQGDYKELTDEFRNLQGVVELLNTGFDDTVQEVEALRELGVPVELAETLVRIAGNADDTASALEEALETQEELRQELAFLQTAEGERLMRIEQQNDELERQIEFTRTLFHLRQSGNLERRVQGTGPTDPIEALRQGWEERRKQQEEILELTNVHIQTISERQLEALERRFDAQSRYYMRLDDLRQYNAERHRLMLEEMDMSQTEWLTTTLEGMQLLKQMSAEVFGGIGELARATFDRRVQQAVRSYDEEAAALCERGLTEKEIVEELGKTREEARKDAEEQNRRFFQFQKAAAIADAVVNTYAAANEALASAPPPFNYALAAGVVAAGLANVQKIRSQQIGGPARAGSRGSRYNSPYETTGERDPRRRQRSGSNAPSINAPPRPSRASSSQRIEFVHRFEEAELHGDTIRYAIRESERRENR